MSTSLNYALSLKRAKTAKRQVTKESLGIKSQSINTRTWHMFEEAMEFKAYIQLFEEENANIKAATTDFFQTIYPLLSVPLPRVWNLVEGDLAEPVKVTESHGHPNTAGGDHDVLSMKSCLSHFDKCTQADVRRPLITWLDALELVQVRFPELTRLYKEANKCSSKVDKTVKEAESKGMDVSSEPLATLEEQEEFKGSSEAPASQRSGEVKDSGAAKIDRKKEDMSLKVHHSQRQLDAARSSFDQQEQLLYEHLSSLCRDAAWLKSYMASSMMFIKEMMQENTFWLGSTMQPLPMFSNRPEWESEQPTMSDNLDLIRRGKPGYVESTLEDWHSEPAAYVRAAPNSAQSPLEMHTQSPFTPLRTSVMSKRRVA